MKCANKTMTSHEGGVAPAAFFFCPLPFGSKKKQQKKSLRGHDKERQATTVEKKKKDVSFCLVLSFF